MDENKEVEIVKDETVDGNELLEMINEALDDEREGLTYVKAPFDYDEDTIGRLIFSDKEFKNGTKSASYFAGYWNTLLNSGVPEEVATELMLFHQQSIYNKEVSEINKTMNIEMSKNQGLTIEKNQF